MIHTYKSLRLLCSSSLRRYVMASASLTPLRAQSSIAITATIGGESNRKAPPADVVSDLSPFVSDVLGHNASSSVASPPPPDSTPRLLILITV